MIEPDRLERAWRKLLAVAPAAWISLHPAKTEEQKKALAEVISEAEEEPDA